MTFAFRSLVAFFRKEAWLTLAALAYVASVLGFALALRFVGEASTLTTIGLYLPRWPLAVPLPILLALLARRGRRWLFALELVAAFGSLFLVLGLRLGHARAPTPGRQLLRVLTFNIDSGRRPQPLVAALGAAHADLIVLEERGEHDAGFWQRELPNYVWSVRDQFVLGSRFPVVEVTRPFRRGSSYVRFRLQLPSGLVDLYALHPPSPRLTMRVLLDEDVRDDPDRLREAGEDISANAFDRERQLRVVADDARASSLPVIIAGDTNLPDLSPALMRTFAGFHDAFREVGRGFGYTFPVGRRWLAPWMRIDRVFVNDAFRVLDCSVLPPAGSDHLGVLAVVEL